MVFSNAIEYNLARSLRYVTDTGDASSSVAPAFPIGSAGTSKFIVNEQAFDLVATGLKPGTVHRAFINGVDVTAFCKQVGKTYGAGLTSEVDPFSAEKGLTARLGGSIYFTFYYSAEIAAATPVEQAGAAAELIASQRILRIASNDGNSVAEIAFTPPLFAKNELDVKIQKTPSATNVKSDVAVITNSTSSATELFYTPQNFAMIQTFYADPESVRGAGNVFLTSIDLFFKAKPNLLNNVTGNPLPGVSIAICEVENNQPVISRTYVKSLSYKDYPNIYSYSDASTPVTFGFIDPLKITTGRFYGIVVIFEDPAYALWTNVVGNSLLGTNTPSSGVNSNKDGNLFRKNNANVFNSISNTDLKFNVRVAKFFENVETKTYITDNYEFLTVDSSATNGNFLGGESVFKDRATETGTLSITQGSDAILGSFTDFTGLSNSEIIVIRNGVGPSNTHIAVVKNVVNATYMTTTSALPYTNTTASYTRTVVGKVYYQDNITGKLYLSGSTANVYTFAALDTIVGTISGATANVISVDDVSLDRVRAKADVSVPSTTELNVALRGTKFDPAAETYSYSDNNTTRIVLNAPTSTEVNKYNSYILSRSNELAQATPLYSNTSLLVDKKSLKVDVTYRTTGNPYQSPIVKNSLINLFVINNLLSNNVQVVVKDSVGNDMTIDSEVIGNGSSLSRHLGKKVNFAAGRRAEDVRVYMTAYRPLDSDVKIYAKLYNSEDLEAFDDKVWSPLAYIGQNANKYSSSEDSNDFIEYELGLQNYPEAANTLPIPFKTTYNSPNLVVTDPTRLNPSNYVVAGDVVRVFDSVFPDSNYVVVPVASANSTQIVLATAITSNNVVGNSITVEKVKYTTSAFNNPENDNICRYYNNDGAAYDTFNTMQIKIVFTGDFSYRAPKVDQLQVIGVSA